MLFRSRRTNLPSSYERCLAAVRPRSAGSIDFPNVIMCAQRATTSFKLILSSGLKITPLRCLHDCSRRFAGPAVSRWQPPGARRLPERTLTAANILSVKTSHEVWTDGLIPLAGAQLAANAAPDPNSITQTTTPAPAPLRRSQRLLEYD